MYKIVFKFQHSEGAKIGDILNIKLPTYNDIDNLFLNDGKDYYRID